MRAEPGGVLESMSPFVVVAIFAGLGALFAVLAIPLLLRRVPRNALYGARFAATFADQHVWYETNADSGRWMLALGIGVAISGAVLPWLVSPDTTLVLLMSVLVIGTLAGAIRSYRFANRLLRERRALEGGALGSRRAETGR